MIVQPPNLCPRKMNSALLDINQLFYYSGLMKEFDPNLGLGGGIILPGVYRPTRENPIAHQRRLEMEIERMERESGSDKKANLNFILPADLSRR